MDFTKLVAVRCKIECKRRLIGAINLSKHAIELNVRRQQEHADTVRFMVNKVQKCLRFSTQSATND